MALISTANAKILTDYLGAMYNHVLPIIGTDDDASSPVAGTFQNLSALMLDVIVSDLDDKHQIGDMMTPADTVFGKSNVEKMLPVVQPILQAINTHCQTRGRLVDTSINSLSTFLSYYNGGSGGSQFANMLSPEFAALWLAIMNSSLPVAGVASPAIHPSFGGSSNGMGKRAVGGSYTDGDAVDTTKYSDVLPLIEVITLFADGDAAPEVTVAGTDHTGATSTTWSVTLTGSNPPAAVSTTTTEAISAQTRDTITLASGTGIVAGSVLTINAGLDDEEHIVVESIATADITACFRKAHDSGAAVTGFSTYAMTPSVAGRRLRNASGITLTVTTHTAGQVRIVGRRERGIM